MNHAANFSSSLRNIASFKQTKHVHSSLSVVIQVSRSKSINFGSRTSTKVRASNENKDYKFYWSKSKAQLANEAEIVSMLNKGTMLRVAPEEVASLARSKWRMLDVRPEFEYERASVAGSAHVPVFVNDNPFEDVASAVMNYVHFSNMGGGWYMGDRLTILNTSFVEDVLSLDAVSTNTPLLLVCQDGRRSLYAAKLLYEAGFKNLAVLEEGFVKCGSSGLKTNAGADVKELRLAGSGAVSRVVLDALGR